MHFRTWGDAPEPLVQKYLCNKNIEHLLIDGPSCSKIAFTAVQYVSGNELVS